MTALRLVEARAKEAEGAKAETAGTAARRARAESFIFGILYVRYDTERMDQKVMWNVEAKPAKEMDGGQLIKGRASLDEAGRSDTSCALVSLATS